MCKTLLEELGIWPWAKQIKFLPSRCFCSAGGDRQACNSERKQVGRRLLLCLCVREHEKGSVSQGVREVLANEGDVEKRPMRGEGESHMASWGSCSRQRGQSGHRVY